MERSLFVQNRDTLPDDEVVVVMRLGPNHKAPRPVTMSEAKFQVAVKIAGNGSGGVHGD